MTSGWKNWGVSVGTCKSACNVLDCGISGVAEVDSPGMWA